MLEFFQDYENCFSQKRLQVFMAFIVAVILAFFGYDANYVGLFLTYGSLNVLMANKENKFLSHNHLHDK